MIWKTVLVISVAHYVLSEQEEGAVSEQRVTIHHSKPHITDHSDGDKKSESHEEYAWAYPSYEFSYKVNDPHTHDIKGQNENRHGDEVKGIYWLLEPNGDKRTVNYNANDHKGFNAQVDYARNEKNNENKEDNNGYSVHEEQIEDIGQNKNEENNDETNNKEVMEEENKKENNQENKEENNQENQKENNQENNQEINEAAENNPEENQSEKNNDNFKENESIVAKRIWIPEEGENVDVIRRQTEFSLSDDDERLVHIQQHDIKRNIYKNHKKDNDKTAKYEIPNARINRINLNNHDEQANNRGFSKQEKKRYQSKNIESNNGGHKIPRRKEVTTRINQNEKRKDENSENKGKIKQINFSKSKSENEAATDKIYIGKLIENESQNNDDKESEIYQHSIYINHPKFSISSSKQKKHRH